MFKWTHIVLAVILVLGAVLAGCSSTSRVAKNGDTVQVDYTGKLADGTMFDSTADRGPFEFTLGAGQAIYGFDNAVTGMKVGEKKTVTIPADDAYGQYRDELIIEISPDTLPENVVPEVGQVLRARSPDGRQIMFTVLNISDNGTLTLDANHRLAGKDLTFDIELIKIVSK